MKGQTNAVLTLLTGDILNLKLVTNLSSHEDLVGATITIDYGIVKTFTWEGKDITVQIPQFLNYTITVSDIEGYTTPNAQTFTAKINNVNNLVMLYNTELVTVNVSADNGVLPDGYEITISKVTEKTEQISTGYTELEYIQSSGSQYIKTGIYPNQNTKIEISAYTTDTSNDKPLFGERNGNKVAFLAWTNPQNSAHPTFAFHNTGNVDTYLGFASGVKHTIVLYNGVFSCDGKVYSFATKTFNSSYELLLFGLNNAGSVDDRKFYGRVYSCQIYESGTIVRDYIPVKRNSDGVCGLLDKVENKFYASNSSTAFTAGTVIGEITEDTIITEYKPLYTQTTPSATYKIPYGTLYIVKASDVSGYTTPSEQSFTASQPLRNVNVGYKCKPIGVCIVDADGDLVDVDSWTGGSNATGIYVSDGEHSLIVAPDEKQRQWWGRDDKNVSVSGIVTTLDQSTALADFAGSSNTDQIISQLTGYDGGSAPAAEYCRTYSSGCKGIGEWYLPAAGEMNVLVTNIDAINTALSKISGIPLGPYTIDSWTSTQCDSRDAWRYVWSEETFLHNVKWVSSGVRPVCQL